MKQLLSQNWYVVRHSALLWLIVAVMFAFSAWSRLDSAGNVITPGLGIVYAFFAAEYFGDAGTSGRLDGRIIHGCPRARIFMADFLTILFCFWLVLAATLAGEVAAAALLQELSDYDILGWTAGTGGLMLNAAAYAGVFALAGLMLTGRRPGRGTVLLIVCLCLFAVFLVWGMNLYDALNQPEYVSYVEFGDATFVSGVPEPDAGPGRTEPNPYYVHEPERSRVEAMAQFLPVTQCLWLHDLNSIPVSAASVGVVSRLYLYALLLACGSCAAGLLLFRRRELD